MRRSRQQMSQADVLAVVARGTSGVLALVDADGEPYAVPLSYAYRDGKFYFHSAQSGHKVDAVKHCARASFCIVDRDEVVPEHYTTHYRSVIAFGGIRILADDAERLEALRLIGDRYYPGHEDALRQEIEKFFSKACVMEMNVERITGKESLALVREREKEDGHA